MRRLAVLTTTAALLALAGLPASAQPTKSRRRPVPKEHPRLFGPRHTLAQLALKRADAYKRMASVARKGGNMDEHARLVSQALVSVIDNDRKLGREAVTLALRTVRGPIRKGHVTFGHDLARCAIVYDLCHEHWTAVERKQFITYVNATIAANKQSERHVFHNGWYGYKNWGIGLACYATYHENPLAPVTLKALEEEFRTRAGPALEMAGEGGGWAEGYYVNYWLYEWLVFCHVAQICEGVDYLGMAPKFFRHRAVASLFEAYPGIQQYGSRRACPTGDSGGRVFGGDRDKTLSARRILVNRYRTDPAHRVVHAFNETTPRSGVGNFAYKDFLWRDPSVAPLDLARFRRSHVSTGPGFVYARSDWTEDATWFFFKCGDRFTAHQHLDVGHFMIYRHAELAGDGGHYDGFGSAHDVNYHLRTIAHNTLLVHDAQERWPGIRAGSVTANDGGQHHAFPHHNGAVSDAAAWLKTRTQHDIATLLAYEDRGAYLYVAGDCTRAYSSKKLLLFTRQIVYLRPGTFVVFDRVRTREPRQTTWLLQAMEPPTGKAPNLVVTHGKGRLFVQTLLPADPVVKLVSGPSLYTLGGKTYAPSRDTGVAPRCRIEVSPANPGTSALFLHVLTATDATVPAAPRATARVSGGRVEVRIGKATVRFDTGRVGGAVRLGGAERPFARKVTPPK